MPSLAGIKRMPRKLQVLLVSLSHPDTSVLMTKSSRVQDSMGNCNKPYLPSL
jgi:hypothetical protein